MHLASLIAAVVAFAFAALWAVIGLAGLAGRFPGNRWAGVRTAETVSSQEAWVLAHRVAAPGFLGGAVVAVLGGLLSLANRWGFVYALGGLLIGLLAVSMVSGVAVRAAQALVPPQEQSGGCSSGCCSGGEQTDGADHSQTGSADPAADCGESSCGSCALSGMCLPESQASDSHQP
ncbi:SdpI family protein [Gordonia hirsuta]|uniref:SdpI family protein n=1 Tax=Gordonia hirsuta TaxID=53427 RepID=UPI00046294F4|nr:SdpI family protein [Gordonia hirsuta]